MRMIRTALFAGAALLGLAGAAVAAERHVMTVDLPSGAVARVAYQGDVAPVVKIVPAGNAAMPVAGIGWDDPFADLDGLFAELQAQHVAMMRQAAALAAQVQAQDGGDGNVAIDQASAGDLPAGNYSYTFVSTTTGNGTCGHVVEVTARGNAAPQRISRSFGDCGESAAPAPAQTAPAQAAPRPAVPTT